MKVLTFALGQLQANCYLIINDKECLIIDPADEASFILEEIQRRGLQVKALLVTHGHFDHVMAVGEIQAALPHIPFYIRQEDKFLLKRLKETVKYFLGYEPPILQPARITSLNVGATDIDSFKFETIHTPGHTPGSVCYYFHDSPGQTVIFTGDTLFAGAIGRFDFSYSNKKDLKNSLQTILKLPKGTKVYPGHGEETQIANEKGLDTLII